MEKLTKKLETFIESTKEELKKKPNSTKISEFRNKLTDTKIKPLFKEISKLAETEKAKAGQLINSTKQQIESLINNYLEESFSSEGEKLNFDITQPGTKPQIGSLHPETQILDLVEEAFGNLGFSVAEGPNIETDYYCFEMLNMPEEHPARDMQDSFYLNKEQTILPRTHTSAVQIRYMLEHKPPIKIIVPGRCYRNEAIDARHFIEFYQFEGLVVDDHTTIADLKGTIEAAMQKVMDEPNLKVRFRHCYFPYTEPSFEIDFSCHICDGKGYVTTGTSNSKRTKCKLCSGKGWLEIGGLGMVHPQVLRNVNIDPEKFQGFAFGWGPARIAMIKHGIEHLRYFWDADLRFLKQF